VDSSGLSEIVIRSIRKAGDWRARPDRLTRGKANFTASNAGDPFLSWVNES
jgi:hypothetical protein